MCSLAAFYSIHISANGVSKGISLWFICIYYTQINNDMTVLQRTSRFCTVSPGAARFSNTIMLDLMSLFGCRIAENEKGELTTALLLSFVRSKLGGTNDILLEVSHALPQPWDSINNIIYFRLSLPTKKDRPTLLFPAAIFQTLSHIRRVAPTHSFTR